jgi:hypothetical protein
MDKINEEQLKLEIAHIFDNGANELRVFEMVKNFIDSRNVVNKNFVLADVSISVARANKYGRHQFNRGYMKLDLVPFEDWQR